MQPKIVQISPFLVSGLTIRTKNSDEFIPISAKIPTLWGQFFSRGVAENCPTRLADSPIFGVYSAYESDATGSYNVTAGVSVSTPHSDFSNIEIQAGEYMVFKARGPMPAAVIQAWTAVWVYFEQHPHVKRCFLTDFESYHGLDEVQIHIGVHTDSKS